MVFSKYKICKSRDKYIILKLTSQAGGYAFTPTESKYRIEEEAIVAIEQDKRESEVVTK